MGDTVAILPELSFRQQVVDLATHISRSLPSAADQNATRDYVQSVESSLGPEEEEVPGTKRVEVVKALVTKVGEARGALEGLKEGDVELSHLLLQNLLSSTLSGSEYDSAVRSVVDALRKGAEANLTAGRLARVEVAARILNNTYNSLSSASPLRPAVFLVLVQLLPKFTDLSSVLSLSPAAIISISRSASNPDEFRRAVSDVYAQAGLFGIAADIVGGDRAVVLGICDEKRFDFAQLQKQQLGQEASGLVSALEAGDVKGWIGANDAFIQAQGLSKFSAQTITRKSHLLALARLFATSSTRSLSFSSIASSLSVPVDEVDEYIFDGTSSGLFSARITQSGSEPSVKVISVSKAASPSSSAAAGGFEWDLLAKRLGDWKKTVQEARRVVGDAERTAEAQLSEKPREDRYRKERRDKKEGQQQQQQHQQQQGEEVVA